MVPVELPRLRAAEYPRPRHFIVHISDTHFVRPGELLSGTGDPRARLRQLVTSLVDSGVQPEAIIITGDLADLGEPEAYRDLRSVLEPAARRLGAELIWVMGNHDHREAMYEHLLDEAPSGAPYDRVVMIGGLRIVVLDSTVPGYAHGEITDEQLQWLTQVLAEPSPEGTILALHHPPVPCVQDLAITVELRDQQRLATVLRGSDVRAILGGHLHYSTSATFAGIPVSVAAATCYTQDLFTPGRGTRGRDAAQAVHLVHVYDHTIMHSVAPVAGGVTVGRHVDAVETARILAAEGLYIPDCV
nr:phosphodiesterase [Nesterenkonia massiliensis]